MKPNQNKFNQRKEKADQLGSDSWISIAIPNRPKAKQFFIRPP